MTDTNKKEFKAGTYAIIAGVGIAVLLVVLTIFAFTTRYTAFSPEKVAQAYTDTIVQTGDGYNAYKNTLVSKDQKYGDFIINAYMRPYVNEDAEQNEIIGTGTEEEAKLLDEIYATMYSYYLELLATYGLDDYDNFYSNYFAKLTQVRHEVLSDEYMDTEFMFSVFEANVDQYGKSLTGTQRVFGADNVTITQEQTEGAYQKLFGTEQDVKVDALVDGKKKKVTEKQLVYRLTATVTDTQELSEEEVINYAAGYKERVAPMVNSAEAKADSFGLENTTKEKKILFIKKTEEVNTKSNFIDAYAKLDCSDEISAVDLCTVDVMLDDGTVVATQQVYVVKIGNSWYVDNTNTNTTGLYFTRQ